MSAAWFGLIGVIVGGLISTLWSWLAVVRQELSDAVVAARLVDDDLCALQEPSRLGDAATPDTATWIANRAALAKALGKAQWEAVSAVYRAPGAAMDGKPSEQLGDRLCFAREKLQPWVAGKRYGVLQRFRDLFSARRSHPAGGP